MNLKKSEQKTLTLQHLSKSFSNNIFDAKLETALKRTPQEQQNNMFIFKCSLFMSSAYHLYLIFLHYKTQCCYALSISKIQKAY
jgi:hypothetical protein